MALQTVATHLADLGETRARTREYESSTRRRDTLLPYEAEKKSLDNDSTRLILSELHKDVAYNDLVRENKITDQQSVRDMYDALGPTRLVANLLVAKELEAKENDVKLVVAENDLLLNKFGPFYNQLEDHFNRIGDSDYDAVAGLNRLEGQYDMLNQELATLGLSDQRKQIDAAGNFTESGDMVTAFGMLPGGRSQGEPITSDNFQNFTSHRTIMEDYSKEANSMLKQRLAEESAIERQRIGSGAKGKAPDPYGDIKNLAESKNQIAEQLLQYHGGPDGAYDADDKGTIMDKQGFESPNEFLRNIITNAVNREVKKPGQEGNYANIRDDITRQVGEHVRPYSGEYDPKGMFSIGQDYNTYVPTKGTQEYIKKLEEALKQFTAQGHSPQNIADKMMRQQIFKNMVTSTPGQ